MGIMVDAVLDEKVDKKVDADIYNNPNLFNNRGKIQQLKLFDHI